MDGKDAEQNNTRDFGPLSLILTYASRISFGWLCHVWLPVVESGQKHVIAVVLGARSISFLWTMRGTETMRGRVVISAVVLTIAAVGQIILSFLLYNGNGNVIIRNAGWVILWISAIFGWLPIFTFQKWGGVPKGKGYTHTTVLVDRGVYGIVRHPQYLAGILMGVGLSLIVQHWVVGVLGAVVAITSYADTFEEERVLREKFGAEYEAYRGRVPRVNFVIGIGRLLWRKRR